MLTTTPKRNPASKSNRSDAVLDRLRAMRGRGESYSDVILRLVGIESACAHAWLGLMRLVIVAWPEKAEFLAAESKTR